MRRNLIVLCGALIVFISAAFLPMITFSQQISNSAPEQVDLPERTGIILAILILLVLLLKWKLRGILWIIFGIIGPLWTPMSVMTLYNVGNKVMLALDPSSSRGAPTFLPGFYLVIFGYIVVIVGAVWDIIQKRKPVPAIN